MKLLLHYYAAIMYNRAVVILQAYTHDDDQSRWNMYYQITNSIIFSNQLRSLSPYSSLAV
jgi:hypothetical protein